VYEMEHKRYIEMQKSIKGTRQSESMKNPLFIIAVAIFGIMIVWIVAFAVPQSHIATAAISNITNNQTYISSLASNSLKMAASVASIQGGLANIILIEWLVMILFIFFFAYGFLVFASWMSERTPSIRAKILENLKKEGYTDAEIKEYLRTLVEERTNRLL
jgi:uncharacterized membrane protein